MFDKYGSHSVCSPNQYYFEKHGVSLPKEENEEAIELLAKIPMLTLDDYKVPNSITWSKIKSEVNEFRVNIKIYNSQLEACQLSMTTTYFTYTF